MKLENNFELSAGYFGKLPKFADFVKYNAGGEEILDIDRWLQEGMVAAKNEFKSLLKENYSKSLQFNFFYPFTSTSNNLTGLISPGYDKSEREFPFLIFYIMNKNFYSHIPAYLIPLVNQKNLVYFKELCEYSKMSNDLLSINDEMKKIVYKLYPSDALLDYQKFLSNTSQEIFWERTFGNFTDPAKYALINNLDKLRTFSNISSGIKISFNLENEHTEFELAFFIQLILTMANKISYLPSLFWSAEIDTINLYIFFNRPSAQQFVDIIFQKDSEERIIQAEKFEDEKELMNSVHSSYKKLLEKNNLTLSDFLRAIQ